MKIQYYAETDSLYIELSSADSSDSKEVSEGVVLDFDTSGNIVGILIHEGFVVKECRNSHETLSYSPFASFCPVLSNQLHDWIFSAVNSIVFYMPIM
jgi:uncharacterized protein YuzE